MHPHNGALPGLYLPVPVTCGALVEHRHTYALPCCRTSQYCRTFIPLSVSLWNNFADPIFDDLGQVGSKKNANVFFIYQSC